MAKRTKNYRSEIAQAVHEGINGMRHLGLVDKQTMSEFDVRCLTSVDDLSASDVQALRKCEEAGPSSKLIVSPPMQN